MIALLEDNSFKSRRPERKRALSRNFFEKIAGNRNIRTWAATRLNNISRLRFIVAVLVFMPIAVIMKSRFNRDMPVTAEAKHCAAARKKNRRRQQKANKFYSRNTHKKNSTINNFKVSLRFRSDSLTSILLLFRLKTSHPEAHYTIFNPINQHISGCQHKKYEKMKYLFIITMSCTSLNSKIHDFLIKLKKNTCKSA